MENNPKLLKLLELASQQWRQHLENLWQEEKHYTWWIYIIFIGLFYINSINQLDKPYKTVLIALGSLFGVFVSVMGYVVVRRESVFFHEAYETYKRTAIVLGLNQPIPSPNFYKPIKLMELQRMREFGDELKEKANKPLKKLLASPFKKQKRKDFSIRDCFQLGFIVVALLFIVFGILLGIVSSK